MKLLALTVGSIAGGFARYFLAGFIYSRFGSDFPYGTLVVNLLGCFIIGFLSALADEKFLLGPEGKILLMVGFCGAFTTFSTFMLETANLLKSGEMLKAFANVTVSVLAGFFIFKLGTLAPKLIWH